jgi:hypothetical protein
MVVVYVPAWVLAGTGMAIVGVTRKFARPVPAAALKNVAGTAVGMVPSAARGG